MTGIVLSVLSLLVGAGILGLVIYSEDIVVQYGILPKEFDDSVRGIFSEAYTNAVHPRLREQYGMYAAPVVSLSWYIAYEIVRMTLVHLGAFFALSGLRSAWYILDDPKARSLLARAVMNATILGACGYRGIMMWRDMIASDRPPASLHELTGALSNTSSLSYIPSTPQDRLYQHMPDFQRLAAVMAAFQLKNLVDTIYYKDGILFFIHHLITVTVAAWALYPFAHFHGTFFFGVSETSTTLLAILVNFSADYGVPALEKDFPFTRKFIGFIFAVSFILVRSILWPFFSYFFIKDCLALLNNKSEHDTTVVLSFVIMLLTLSVMQIIWLFEIVITVYRELFAPSVKGKETKTA